MKVLALAIAVIALPFVLVLMATPIPDEILVIGPFATLAGWLLQKCR